MAVSMKGTVVRMDYNSRDLIFYKSIQLIADSGYENVSMRNIASAVGIKAASIYNHYECKEAILDSIFDYFEEFYPALHPTPEEYMPVLKTGSAQDILNIVNFPLKEPMDVNFNVIRIVWAGIYTNTRARQIYQKYIIEGDMQFLRNYLHTGKKLGRIDITDDEIESLSVLFLGTRIFTASAVVADPKMNKWRRIELDAADYLARLLKVNPPIA